MKTYYTKCGRKFQKSSTAAVTGYLMESSDVQCHGDTAGKEPCPFRIQVNKGWPPVFDRWECRAGSKEPNHKNEWGGSLEDKNSIYVKSLDHNFLETVLGYCNNNPNLSASYNQDLEDCRRILSIQCSSNKKGIAAKKEFIEKFIENKKSNIGCQNVEMKEAVCPKKYIDEKGRLIFVRAGIGQKIFKAHYQDAGKWNSPGAHRLRGVKWRDNEKDAQDDLDSYAKQKKWEALEETRDVHCKGVDDMNCNIESCGFNNGGGGCGYSEEDISNPVFEEYAKESLTLGCRNKKLKEALNQVKESKEYEPTKEIVQESALDEQLSKIRYKVENIINNFIEIGFTLLEIRNTKGYEAKGYNNLIECVEAELKMKKSTCYNLMKIAEKFGDPDTKSIKNDYKHFGYVQLLEMTTMSEEEMSQVSPDMSKREIKEVKNSNRLEKVEVEKESDSDPDVDLSQEPDPESEDEKVNNFESNVIDVDFSYVEHESELAPENKKESSKTVSLHRKEEQDQEEYKEHQSEECIIGDKPIETKYEDKKDIPETEYIRDLIKSFVDRRKITKLCYLEAETPEKKQEYKGRFEEINDILMIFFHQKKEIL